MKKTLLFCAILACTSGIAWAAERTYPIRQKPSDLVQDHNAVAALASTLERDLLSDVEKTDPADKALLSREYRSLFNAALVQKHYGDARRYGDLVRSVQANPATRAATGVITMPYLDAIENPGTDFRATYRARLSERLATLPLEQVGPVLGALKDSLKTLTRDQLISATAGLDGTIKDGLLSQGDAESLLLAAMNLEVVLLVRDDAVVCLEKVIGTGETQVQIGSTERPHLGTPKARLEGAYFGQTPPGETPVPFAPDVFGAINTWVEGVSFSPDGMTCFISVGDAFYTTSSLYYTTRKDGVWGTLAEPPFTSGFTLAAGPTFSTDGKRVTFSGKKSQGSLDLWTVDRTPGGWGTPVVMPAPINGELNENPGTFMRDGTMYFSRTKPKLQSQVLRAFKNQAGELTVEVLGAPINASPYDGDPCIAPDGHFLVFYSARADSVGGTDLYVSFADGQGGWKTPVNLGRAFNSQDDEYGPHLSADGKYLFYTRHSANQNQILWVAASAIEKLRAK